MDQEKKFTPKYISQWTGVDEKKIRDRLRKTLPRIKSEKNSRWNLDEEEALEQIDYWNNK